MSLSIPQVEHLAELARIKLTQEEKEKYAKELSSILEYVQKLQEIKVDKKFESEEKENRLRDDKVVGISSMEQNELINLAPETEERLIKAKAVFE